MRKMRFAPSLLILLLGLTGLAPGAADGTWLYSVPTHEHDKANPFAGRPEAVAAGRRIFEDRCAGCHGKNAEGHKKRPPLKSERVQLQATEGDLHWLLVNGNLWKGMPSWSKLPDPQIWQVVSYLKSLKQ